MHPTHDTEGHRDDSNKGDVGGCLAELIAVGFVLGMVIIALIAK